VIKLKPISRQEYEIKTLQRSLQDAIESIPDPIKGDTGRKGEKGLDGKDGVTTTVTKEVLASKEKLLTKEEFKKFKKMMMDMENDLRMSIARSFNVGGGGGASELVHVIEVSESTTITKRQLKTTHFNVILVTTAGITITLPEPSPTKIVWVQQGYTGTGEFTVCKS